MKHFLKSKFEKWQLLFKLLIFSLIISASFTRSTKISNLIDEFILVLLFAGLLLILYDRFPMTVRPLGLAISRNTVLQAFLIPVSIVNILILSLGKPSLIFASLLSSVVVLCLLLSPIKATHTLLLLFFQFLLGASLRNNGDEHLAYQWFSLGTRDIVASEVTNSQLSFSEFQKLVMDSELLTAHKHFATLNNSEISIDVIWLMNLARLIAIQPISDKDLLMSLKIYKLVWKCYGSNKFRVKSTRVTQQHSKVYLDLLLHHNEVHEWIHVLGSLKPLSKNKLTTDIDKYHPKISGTDSSLKSWESAFNKQFRKNGLEELSFKISSKEFIDSIICDPKRFIDGPLVTVIVSAYNPGPELLTSVRSICNQTWRNLEILVVDDSSDQTEFIEICRNLDSRINVIRQSPNAGTYSARNLAITKSNGEFIVTHDSDDWMHPQRIERHVVPLLRDDRIKATVSRAIRMGPDLILSQLGFSPFRHNASSLTFRKSLVEEIGYFDDVRKAADSEFDSRIRFSFPGSVLLVGDEPLSLVRLGHDSLSRSDFKPMWSHPARHSYKNSYFFWHSNAKKLGEALYISKNQTVRKFAAPQKFLTKHLAIQVDVVLVSSFTDENLSESENNFLEITNLVSRGLSVAILQNSPLRLSVPLSANIQDLVNRGEIRQISQDDSVHCETLLFKNIKGLQIESPLKWCVESNNSFIHSSEIFIESLDVRKLRYRSLLSTYLDPKNRSVDITKVLPQLSRLALNPRWLPTSQDQLNLLGGYRHLIDISDKTWNFEETIELYLSQKQKTLE